MAELCMVTLNLYLKFLLDMDNDVKYILNKEITLSETVWKWAGFM